MLIGAGRVRPSRVEIRNRVYARRRGHPSYGLTIAVVAFFETFEFNLVQLSALFGLAGLGGALIAAVLRRARLMWISLTIAAIGLGIAAMWTIAL